MKLKHLSCLLLVLFSFAFTDPVHILKGIVVDENGTPLDQASIVIKEKGIGVRTDSVGRFSIKLPNKKSTIVVSYIGHDSKTISINKTDTFINIVLKKTKAETQDLIVIGYATASKNKMMRGVAVSTPEEFSRRSKKPDVALENSRYIISKQIKNTADSIHVGNIGFDREGYDNIVENPFLKSIDNPLSTFSIDVDAAAYSNIRRIINEGKLPPHGAVRIEEMINYFSYQYPQPKNDVPFTVNTEMSSCPWNKDHKLVMIGLQGKKIPIENIPASNLTFLIDVSGSMNSPEKLPLVKASLKLLVDQLRPIDKVAIVVYAGSVGVVLRSTSGDKKSTIKDAIERLAAGGSTAGGEGIQLAYKTASENFLKGGNNRVILCTDGDFNVGVSSDEELVRLIEKERESGVFLSVLGFGVGNYQDSKMQKLADKGNGNHAYIDGIGEAKKVFVKEFGGTLFTIAKDVKLQVEFNPAKVQGYRLIGYEKRVMAKEDFNDDKKDAGDMGSGHTVTALYEIIPVGVKAKEFSTVDDLKYQQTTPAVLNEQYNDETMTVKLRYKEPDGNTSKLLEFPLLDKNVAINKTSDNFKFAVAVTQFGMLLRDSKYKGVSNFEDIMSLAKEAIGEDKEGYRKEFIQIVENASLLSGNGIKSEEE